MAVRHGNVRVLDWRVDSYCPKVYDLTGVAMITAICGLCLNGFSNRTRSRTTCAPMDGEKHSRFPMILWIVYAG